MILSNFVILPICVLIFGHFASAAAASNETRLDSWSLMYGVASRVLHHHSYNEGSSKEQFAESSCYKELKDTALALENVTRWAVKMHDASGMPDSGLYWGNVYWLGSKEQCLVYHSEMKLSIMPSMKPKYENSKPPFSLAYFILNIRFNSSLLLKLQWVEEDIMIVGLCLPRSCSPNQLSPLITEYLSTSPLGLQRIYQMNFELVSVKKAEPDDSYKQNSLYTVFIYITYLILLLSFLGTIYGSYNRSSENATKTQSNVDETQKLTGNGLLSIQKKSVSEERSKLHDVLMCFDINKNYHKIFDVTKDEDMLLSINGWRVTNIVAVVMNHTVVYNLNNTKNKHLINYLDGSYLKQIIFNTAFGIDSFYVLSGFLVGNSFFKNNDIRDKTREKNWKKSTKDFFKGVLKRYLRLTPQYLYTILFGSFVYSYLRPTSSILAGERVDETCPKFWWTNMLYINNIYPSILNSCLSWSYYLSNEMQYYIFGSFLLYLSIFYTKLSMAIGVIVSIISGIIVAYMVYIHEYYPYLHIMLISTDYFYRPPMLRVFTYLLGLILAYLFTYHRNLFTGKPLRQVLAWAVWFTMGSYAIFGIMDRDVSLWYSSVYTATSRQAWAIATFIFFYALLTNNVYNKLTTFYSYDIWIPLSKFCYGAYLLNPIVIFISLLTTEKGVYLQPVQTIISALGNVVATFFLSFLMNLFIETPVNNLVNVFSSNTKQRSNENDDTVDRNLNGLSTDRHDKKNL